MLPQRGPCPSSVSEVSRMYIFVDQQIWLMVNSRFKARVQLHKAFLDWQLSQYCLYLMRQIYLMISLKAERIEQAGGVVLAPGPATSLT